MTRRISNLAATDMGKIVLSTAASALATAALSVGGFMIASKVQGAVIETRVAKLEVSDAQLSKDGLETAKLLAAMQATQQGMIEQIRDLRGEVHATPSRSKGNP